MKFLEKGLIAEMLKKINCILSEVSFVWTPVHDIACTQHSSAITNNVSINILGCWEIHFGKKCVVGFLSKTNNRYQ